MNKISILKFHRYFTAQKRKHCFVLNTVSTNVVEAEIFVDLILYRSAS